MRTPPPATPPRPIARPPPRTADVSADASALFEALDADRSGAVSLAEARRSIPTLGWEMPSDGYIDGLWRVYDLDGSGLLGPDEFGRLLAVLRNHTPSRHTVRNPLSQAGPSPPPPRPLPRPVRGGGERQPQPQPQPQPEPEPEPELMDGAAPSAAMMIAANAAAMSEDELTDLTYAFQAADMDGGGAIDAAEFTMMLSVMGCEISPAQVERVIQEAEQGFAAWMKAADAENVKKCTAVWDEFDADKSGTMDRTEINLMLGKLREMGFSPTPISEADMNDGELSFDEFVAWFLAQEGLPAEFSAPDANATAGGLGKAKAKKKGKLRLKISAALRTSKRVAMGAAQPRVSPFSPVLCTA